MRRFLLAVAFIAFFFSFVSHVFAQSNQTVVKGGFTTAVNFTGAGCTYNWVNSNPAIGLPPSGSGNIASFTATSNGTNPVIATITATPVPTNYAYIASYFDNTVSVVNTITNTVDATIAVGTEPLATSVSADGSRVYVSNIYDHTISVINTVTNQVIATIGGVYPEGLIVSPDGSKLYVADMNGYITVISTVTNTIITKITLVSSPYTLAISSDGSKLYAVNILSNVVSVINTITNSVTTVIAVGSQPDCIVLSPDNTKAYVANGSNTISVINTAGNTVTNTISLSFSPGYMCISPDGKELYITDTNSGKVHIINTATNSEGATVVVTGSASAISISLDGKEVYVENGNVQLNNNSNSNTVTVINTATNTVTATIPVGSHPIAFGNFTSSGPGCNSSPVTFTITVNPSATSPAITASIATGTISACVGTASTSPNIQQFTVSGSNLSAVVTTTAPIGFEVSLTANSGFGNSVTLNQSAGNLSSTTVYVRSAAGDAVGQVSGNVVISSLGAASQNVAVSGTVNALPTVNVVPNQTVTNGATTATANFTGTGNLFTWTNDTPSIGLPATGSGNIGSFTAINTGSSPITATVTVTPINTGFAYIANSGSGTVSVINVVTNTLATTITMPSDPYCICTSPDGSKVYVGCDNGTTSETSIAVINTSTNTVTSSMPLKSYGNPLGMIISPDGVMLYVLNSEFGTVTVVNTATNAIIAVISVGTSPHGIAISPDGSKVYVSNQFTDNLSVINTATNTVVANVTIGSSPDIAISPNGTIYASILSPNSVSVINPITYAVIAQIPVSSDPTVLVVSPDGTRVYVATGTTTVSVINTSTNTVIATITAGGDAGGISISPDGQFVYITNLVLNSVSVINTSTNQLIATVPVQVYPLSINNFVTAGTGCSGTPTTFTITVNPTSATPTITAGTVTGNITGCEGAASSDVRQFTVSGSGLTANITATAPLNFEISLNATTGFSNSLTLLQNNGTVSNTIVYVRAAATAPAGNISGNVDLTSAGATNQTVVVSYTIDAIPSVNAVNNQTLTNGAATSPINFSGTAATYNWVNDTPGIGLAANGTDAIPSFTAINNTNNPITATVTVTPLNGTSCSGTPIIFTITVNPSAPSTLTAMANLSPLTTIYGTPSSAESFTVSGTNITDGITISISPYFEVSNNGSTYSSTTTISGNGTITSAPVYIRLAATTPVGSYNGGILLNTNSINNVSVLIPLSTVSPAPLTITADNITKPFGAVNPPLTITYSGFVNNDGPAQLTLKPSVTTTATTQSPIGQYPILASDAVSPNYTFTYAPGILTIEPSLFSLSIPNTFTPNGDGINDTWEIKYLDYYPKSTVNIFNRWGQKLYSSVGYSIPWDGKYNGQVLPVGTYYYMIDPKNGQPVISGWVAIIR